MSKRLALVDSPPRFSREWWLSGSKTFVWVLVVTLLIWVYADLEKTESKDITIRVRLTTGNSGQIQLEGDGHEYEVKFTVRGSNSSIERFSRELGDAGWLVEFDVSQGRLGENTFQLSEILEARTNLLKNGLSISSIAPRFVRSVLVKPTQEFRGRLVLTTPEGGDLVFADRQGALHRREVDVTFTAEGPREGLASLSRVGTDIVVDVGRFGEGANVVTTQELLRSSSAFSRSNLTLTSAYPEEVWLELDRSVTVNDVEVKLVSSGATLEDPQVIPSKVSVAVARSNEESLRAQPRIVLDTVNVDLRSFEPPGPVQLQTMIGGIPVRPQQPTVEVAGKIAQLTGERTLTIPVRLLTPQSWPEDGTWERYVLRRRDPADWRKEITFKGPKSDLDKLQAQHVEAYIVLTDLDRSPTESWLERQVEVRVNQPVSAEVVGPLPKIFFRLEPRDNPQ